MPMIPTPTGYVLIDKLRPAHRAVMDAENAWVNLATRSGLLAQPERGRHYTPTYTCDAVVAEASARFMAGDS